jgi:S-(hydroxymethyl)glutathione dehydrogenase/alcohol dehydrogenase
MSTARSTRAAILRRLKDPLTVERLTVPNPGPGQVVVRIAASGICHSQLHEVRGRRGEDRFLPHLLGHEAAGIVEEVGEGVSRLQPGQKVVLSWIKGSGRSTGGAVYSTAAGEKVNSGPIATFTERAVVSEDRATPLPEGTPFDVGALLGCAVSTGAGAVLNTARVQEGQSVAVFGVGGIGLNAIQAASIAGARMVAAVDVVPTKLDQASRFGATHVLDARSMDVVGTLRGLTEGKGVDVSIESAGRVETMEWAYSAVRTGGGVAVLVGNLSAGQKITLDPFHLIQGKRIVGSWGGDTVPDRDIPRYAAWAAEGRLKIAELITHRYPLDRINEALEALEKGEVARAVLEF